MLRWLPGSPLFPRRPHPGAKTRHLLLPLAMACAAACSGPLLTDGTVEVPAGKFVMGSSLDERAAALELAYAGRGHPFRDAHGWIASELPRTEQKTGHYYIMARAVTQAEYRNYVRITGRAEPFIDKSTWRRQGSNLAYAQVERELWRSGKPDPERAGHPAVLVHREDAARYCRWWGENRNGEGRLPSEAEWERAARGDAGQRYPWGDHYDPRRLNSADSQIGDTVTVGLYTEGISPHGAYDMAGNVFEWTHTRGPDTGSYIVKGGAYTSHGASARAAARHARPAATRHPSIGFRCVLVDPEAGVTTVQADRSPSGVSHSPGRRRWRSNKRSRRVSSRK